jgi:hypothetical protein
VIIKKNYTYDFYKIRTITVGGGRYMGFLNAEDVPSGLGITYSENECFIGNFNDGFLDKFGRMIF